MKRVSIVGSTGSIGKQSLDVIRCNGDIFAVTALAAGENMELLLEQAVEFKPRMVALRNTEKAAKLKSQLAGLNIQVYGGEEGILRCAADDDADILVNGMVGISGFLPTLWAIRSGKNIALANKETLVAGGRLIKDEAKNYGVRIIPVDSEHSAIFQCIGSTPLEQVRRIILTASGGPFFGKTAADMQSATVRDALRHPNWKMGRKITVDSATLMNKGLEVIEARWLFDIQAENIDVVIHPQSIVHSMVEFVDGAVLAQLGTPDMRIPIQHALTYPERRENEFPRYDPVAAGKLEFFAPDTHTFPCLELAYKALEEGGTMPAVLNGANEVAVAGFLRGHVQFTSIPEVVRRVMEKHNTVAEYDMEEILYWDEWSRKEAERIIERIGAG
ncbi:MAG: 1-deoxy-D-xylulose 5-phosphate reductoisomerase [Firmicutes bacterium]|nr:1-deoxy-D-xylulose 5-phosphate reductoisomerase [Bacillota bacterium]MDI6704709.1 1-deoxy-D-xylulose-5-phosphate reductoisomerase [Bacillota bacterium]